MTQRERGKLIKPAVEEHIGHEEQRADPLFGQRFKGGLEFAQRGRGRQRRRRRRRRKWVIGASLPTQISICDGR
jgi:hypothetical protein